LQEHQEIDRRLVQGALVAAAGEDAAEQIVAQVLEQHLTGFCVGGEHLWRAHAPAVEPVCDGKERLEADLRRAMHQDRWPRAALQALVAPCRGVARERRPGRAAIAVSL
jgi:hypothetical protein